MSTEQPADSSTARKTVDRATLFVFVCGEAPDVARAGGSKKAPPLPGDADLALTVRQYAGMPDAAVELFHPSQWSEFPSIPLNVLGAALSSSAREVRPSASSRDQLAASVAKLAATMLEKYREQVAGHLATLGFEQIAEHDYEKIQPRQWVYSSGGTAAHGEDTAYRTVFVVLMTPEGIGEVAGPAKRSGGCATQALAMASVVAVAASIVGML